MHPVYAGLAYAAWTDARAANFPPPGTYLPSVNEEIYSVGLKLVENVPAPVPFKVDLEAASDSGRSDSDKITNVATPKFDIGATDDGFLNVLYQDVFNRSIDDSGLATYTKALAGGTTRAEVVETLLGSLEYRQLLVEGFYERFLLRGSDPGGLKDFVTNLQDGARDEQVTAMFLGSEEYGTARVGP
jgi:hypothetical protein